MIIRKATEKDIPFMVEIYNTAKSAMKEMGIDQWQTGTPNGKTAIDDINSGYSLVCEEEGQIIATAAIYVGEEITYEKLNTGRWLSNCENYGVIHRIAVHSNYKKKGIAIKLMEYAQKLTVNSNEKSIRCDTHMDNIPMQKTLKKFGFEYCGEITILDGTKRIAFEKII